MGTQEDVESVESPRSDRDLFLAAGLDRVEQEVDKVAQRVTETFKKGLQGAGALTNKVRPSFARKQCGWDRAIAPTGVQISAWWSNLDASVAAAGLGPAGPPMDAAAAAGPSADTGPAAAAPQFARHVRSARRLDADSDLRSLLGLEAGEHIRFRTVCRLVQTYECRRVCAIPFGAYSGSTRSGPRALLPWGPRIAPLCACGTCSPSGRPAPQVAPRVSVHPGG